MEFDRAQLKRGVKLSMKGTTPNPMLVALVFSAVVSAGGWLINTVLGGLLTGGSVGSFSELYLRFLQRGYDVEEAMEQAMLMFLSQGPGAVFGVIVGGSVLSLMVSLWSSAMNVGYAGYCLSMVRHENPSLNKIFCALPQIGQVLITRLLTGVFVFLWTLPLGVVYVLITAGVSMVAVAIDSVALMVLLVLAATAAFGAGIVWITLRYALVDYVLLDKGLSGMDAIRESKRLMRGNIGKGFVLQLSFIGWYLLECAIVVVAALIGVVAFGGSFLIDYINAEKFVTSLLGFVGLVSIAVIAISVFNLWLKPYVAGAMAKFYDWAKGGADGFAGGPRCGAGDGGWGQPAGYTWSSGPSSGTGMGSGPRNDSPAPKPPKPKDDPWN